MLGAARRPVAWTVPLVSLSRQYARFNSTTKRRNPIEYYDYLVEKGDIRNDEYQRKMLQPLLGLYNDLQTYNPPANIQPEDPAESSGWMSKLFARKSAPRQTAHLQPKGIYLYGDVGCGKTMLMEMFYATVPKHLTKRRVHFHAFMQGVHKRAHALKLEHGSDFDSTPSIAAEIARESTVLCFDEFQVTDVADAMILRRLIDYLYSSKYGVVTFMTSNRAPDNLYQNGVQRETFLPCIATLKDCNNVQFLLSDTDYRKIPRPSSGAYFFAPQGQTLADCHSDARVHAESWFEFFCQGNQIIKGDKLTVWGRPIVIPKSSPGKVAQFSFSDLCAKSLSAADYLEITRAYPSIVVTDIPLLNVHKADLTRRFITFLDAAYESKTRLAVTAERPFEHLFTDEADYSPKTGVDETVPQQEVDADSDFISEGMQFEGAEERFAFQRALSRLKQMSSSQWLDQTMHD